MRFLPTGNLQGGRLPYDLLYLSGTDTGRTTVVTDRLTDILIGIVDAVLHISTLTMHEMGFAGIGIDEARNKDITLNQVWRAPQTYYTVG